MNNVPLQIKLSYDPVRLTGILERGSEGESTAWDRIRAKIIADGTEFSVRESRLEVPWIYVLTLLRDFGSRAQQKALNFRFVPVGEAVDRIARFSDEVRTARSAKDSLILALSELEIETRLIAMGLTRRKLTSFQLRDLSRLLSIPHGANFSVPGAGKTTVTFALHLLTRNPGHHFIVICPRAALPAWKTIIAECLVENAAPDVREPFSVLEGRAEQNDQTLRDGPLRFLMSYDLMVRQADMLAAYFARQPVHLVLDEAHRMKAGLASQR
jgi:hypothetical protein